MKKEFQNFILNENAVYLGQKLGDILTSLQELQKDSPNMGKRHIMRVMVNIVKQIRKILHSNWTYDEMIYMKELQKIGVSLMKALDTNEDLNQVISNCSHAMEELTNKIGTPINNLGAPAYDKDGSFEES